MSEYEPGQKVTAGGERYEVVEDYGVNDWGNHWIGATGLEDGKPYLLDAEDIDEEEE